jgi:zinc protease
MTVASQASFDEAQLRLPETVEASLANGMSVVAAERHALPLVAVRLEIWAGAAFDPRDRDGLVDFTGQLLRRGTHRRNNEGAVDRTVERVGGVLGIDVDADSIGISISLPSEHLDVALDVVADLARSPLFAAAEVNAAKRRTLASLTTDLDDPSTIADKATSTVLLGEHPYAHPTGGWSRTVSRFKRAEVVSLYRRLFAPERAHLFVVGDVEAARVQTLAKKYFGQWHAWPGEPLPDIPLPQPLSGKRVVIIDKDDATQTQLRLATVGLPRGHADYFPTMVAAGVLGGGFTSRLMEEIRVNRGLSYGASARLYCYRFGGELAVSTFTKTETTAEAVQVALDVCRNFAAHGPSAEELERTATYLNGLFPLQLETNEQIARTLADLRLYQLGDDYVSRFRDRVRGVDANAARTAGANYFPTDRYALVAVGKAKAIKKELSAFGPVEVVPLARWE